MRIADCNWMDIETYLKNDDRAVVPIGSTEQHAYLSLATDNILSERVAIEAAEPLGVPVFPVVSYGITPTFMSYPGTVSLRVETLLRVMGDVFDSLYTSGFRRILVCNGHGGNQPLQTFIAEWRASKSDARVRLHNWWNAPRTWQAVQAIDPASSHASWMENLPWTRLSHAEMPAGRKAPVNSQRYGVLGPKAARELAGDGNFGGDYERSDAEVLKMWEVAVAETRDLIEGPWD